MKKLYDYSAIDGRATAALIHYGRT